MSLNLEGVLKDSSGDSVDGVGEIMSSFIPQVYRMKRKCQHLSQIRITRCLSGIYT
jgi:hypothetical protein